MKCLVCRDRRYRIWSRGDQIKEKSGRGAKYKFYHGMVRLGQRPKTKGLNS
jgi:hypothetical protein